LTEVDWAYYTEPEKNSHFAMKEQVIKWKTTKHAIRNIVDTEVKSIPIAHVHDHSLYIACLFFRYIAIKVFFVDKTRLILGFITIKVLFVY
jgi:hypothetical protein